MFNSMILCVGAPVLVSRVPHVGESAAVFRVIALAGVVDVVAQLQLVSAAEFRQWVIHPVEHREAELNVLGALDLKCLVEGQVIFEVSLVRPEWEVLPAVLANRRCAEASLIEQLVALQSGLRIASQHGHNS